MATLVKGDPKVSFSIATTLRIAPLYPWSSPYNAECWARQHQVPFLESLVWLDLGLNSGLLDHWWTLYSLGQLSKTFLFQAIPFSQTVLIQPIQFGTSIDFIHTQLNVKTVLFQKFQFNISTFSDPFQTI